jgi:hypothetical protein
MRCCHRNTVLPDLRAIFGFKIMRVSISKRLEPDAMHLS